MTTAPAKPWSVVAAQLAAELRRGQCRMPEPCPRCLALADFDLAVAEKAIVQKPRGPELKCTHDFGREMGRCMGCGELVDG